MTIKTFNQKIKIILEDFQALRIQKEAAETIINNLVVEYSAALISVDLVTSEKQEYYKKRDKDLFGMAVKAKENLTLKDGKEISIELILFELKRELSMRKRVYPNLIVKKTLTRHQANRQYLSLERILFFIQELKKGGIKSL